MDWAGCKFGVRRSFQLYWAGRYSCLRQIAHAVFLSECLERQSSVDLVARLMGVVCAGYGDVDENCDLGSS